MVTGANSGMGKETARELARMGATVILGCRSKERGLQAAAELRESAGHDRVTSIELDLSSPASVGAFARAVNERYPTLDILVNNAAASLQTREVTADGVERHWATNVLGPHCLTNLLLPALEASGRGRIVNVSTLVAGGLDLADSQYETRRFSGIAAYRASKQADRMLTWSLARRLSGRPVTVNALNPGYVLSPLTMNVRGPLKLLILLTRFQAVSALDGADTAIWLAASDEVEGRTGQFWNKRREVRCKFKDTPGGDRLDQLVAQQLSAFDVPAA